MSKEYIKKLGKICQKFTKNAQKNHKKKCNEVIRRVTMQE
jgi:hypothetical protein